MIKILRNYRNILHHKYWDISFQGNELGFKLMNNIENNIEDKKLSYKISKHPTQLNNLYDQLTNQLLLHIREQMIEDLNDKSK